MRFGRMSVGEISVRFMGSGDAFGSGGRFQTCIYVQSDEPAATHLLIDCGASSLVAMRRFGVDPSLIDTILLTHLHGDHFGGLPFFILDAQFVSGRKKPLVVAGPPGLEARIFEVMEALFPDSTRNERKFALNFVELEEKVGTTIEPFTVTPYEVKHPSGAPSYALRVVLGGKVITYSGDTSWTDALIPAARDSNLFVCECNFLEKGVPYHLDYQTLMEHREELGCHKLVLTHMSDEMLERIQDLDVEGAEDGKEYTL